MIYILNGPNLNLLGSREPETYGTDTLEDIQEQCETHAEVLGLDIDFRQTNDEGTLVNWVQEGIKNSEGLIINAAAYTHTSLALHDALKMYPHPAIEVHLSNIYQRESFRHKSYVSSEVNGGIFGFGGHGYVLALDAINNLLR